MTNIQNRDKFLSNVAHKLGRERRTDVDKPKWNYQPQWDVLADASADELVDILEKQCQSIHTDFIRTNSTHLNSALLDVLEQYNGRQVIT